MPHAQQLAAFALKRQTSHRRRVIFTCHLRDMIFAVKLILPSRHQANSHRVEHQSSSRHRVVIAAW